MASGASPGPLGTAHPLAAPYQAFETSDGWINVGASNERTWSALVQALGRPSLAADDRFATNDARMRHLDALVSDLEPVFREDTSEGWLRRLDSAGVPAGPIAAVGEMLEHAQTKAREMVIEVEHSRLGTIRSLGTPLKFEGARDGSARSGDRETGPRGAPVLGEHTIEVLTEAGFGSSDVERWCDDGVVVAG